MRIFHRRRGRFPATALDKIAPQRLTAGDQAVMAVRQREHGQEGNRRATNIADAAPDGDPVMVFVMSLFLSMAMAHHGILQTNRAATNDRFCASLCPIGLQLALRRGKCDKDNRVNAGSAGRVTCEESYLSGALLLSKSQLERISNRCRASYLAPGFWGLAG